MSSRSVLLSSRIFDEATIIGVGNEAPGFPVTQLQTPSPRAPWRVNSVSNNHFIADLRDPDFGTARGYGAFGLLFHNGASNVDAWRIRTGPTTTGTGSYDSGVISLWPTSETTGPDSYKNALYYRPRGVHSFHALTNEVDSTVLTFNGTLSAFLDFGYPVGSPGTITGVEFFLGARFRNAGVPTDQMLVTTGAVSVPNILSGSSNFFGLHLGLRSNGQVFAAVGDGKLTGRFSVSGGSYNDNQEHVAIAQIVLSDQSSQRWLRLYVDDQEVAILDIDSLDVFSFDNGDNIIVGKNGAPSPSDWFTGDLKRACVMFATHFPPTQRAWQEIVDDWLDSDSPHVVPEVEANGVGAVLATDASWGFQGNVGYRRNHAFPEGLFTIPQPLGVSKSGGIALLSDPYVRVDIFPSLILDDNFHAGRFVVSRALEPVVVYGSGTPTPVGSPPKLVNSWDAILTREQTESIAYSLSLDRGSSPRVIKSWGGEISPLDGAKPVVMVNDIAAADPWTRHQGTVYGYLDPISPIQISAFDEYRTNITVRGM